MNTYKVTILCESETPKKAREAIEQLGLRAFSIEKADSQRTRNQNRAMHKWFSLIAEHCAERGLTVDALFKNPAEIRITPEIVKQFFREMGMWMFHKDSTAKLTREEASQVITACEKEFAERLDYTDNFPGIEAEMPEDY